MQRSSLILARIKIFYRACPLSWPMVTTSFIFDTSWNTVVLTAYENTSESAVLSTIVLIYITNQTGPRTDPCGMPPSASYHVDSDPFTTTHCRLWLRKALIQSTMYTSRLQYSRTWARRPCGTVSKAFIKITINHVHSAAPVQDLRPSVKYL